VNTQFIVTAFAWVVCWWRTWTRLHGASLAYWTLLRNFAFGI